MGLHKLVWGQPTVNSPQVKTETEYKSNVTTLSLFIRVYRSKESWILYKVVFESWTSNQDLSLQKDQFQSQIWVEEIT